LINQPNTMKHFHFQRGVSAMTTFNSRSLAGLLCAAALLCPATAHAQDGRKKSQPLPPSVEAAPMPAGALEIADAMKAAKVGQEIALRGRIAMAKDAFASDSAVFTLTDDAAAAGCCPKDGSLMETCKLPPAMKATIQIVDESGSPLKTGLDGKGGLRHGAEVFVVGQVASANGSDSLVVSARAIHVPRAGLPIGFFVRQAPQAAKDLSDARKSGQLKKGDTVELRGVIGGSRDPFVEGRAMFTLMGSGLKPCNANPDDKCAQPWDYCCETQDDIKANSATIRIPDDKGNPLRTDIKGRVGIKELSEVVVVGKVAMADKGVLLVDASSIYVVRP
jgi:hypothetical protein